MVSYSLQQMCRWYTMPSVDIGYCVLIVSGHQNIQYISHLTVWNAAGSVERLSFPVHWVNFPLKATLPAYLIKHITTSLHGCIQEQLTCCCNLIFVLSVWQPLQTHHHVTVNSQAGQQTWDRRTSITDINRKERRSTRSKPGLCHDFAIVATINIAVHVTRLDLERFFAVYRWPKKGL